MIQLPYFIVAGPTAVGKSDVAVALAGRVGGEIVGADAFQVYRGLERLTAQPSPALQARVPHHLIGHIAPDHSYDVAQWLSQARAAILEIRGRDRLPIICGGTGLYLRALQRGLADLPPVDHALRSSLEQLTLSQLVARLRQIEPETKVDLKNRRRLIRALEIHQLTGRPPSQFREQWDRPDSGQTGVLLQLERPALVARIERRCASMFEDDVLEEVSSLPEPRMGPTAAKTLGLSLIRECLAGRLSRAEAKEQLIISTRQYAKRQMTWFRREQGLTAIGSGSSVTAVDAIVKILESI